MKRFKKYNDLTIAREEFDKFCLNHLCDNCLLYLLHPVNESNKHLGCFGSWLDQEIDEDSTADVQEVKHGKWIDDGWGDYIKMCSCCGRLPLSESYGEPCYSEFCPHCGARMDGENNAEIY